MIINCSFFTVGIRGRVSKVKEKGERNVTKNLRKL